MDNSKKQKKSIDIYRLIAMLLVMWGHLLGTGMFALEIPGIINGTMSKTIIEYNGDFLSAPDMFFYYRLHTQAAVIGVVMFFICTGYLVPMMRERYSRREFLVNRALRIFPTLWACIAVVGIVVYVSQRISFSVVQYFTSALLLQQVFHIVPVMSLLWTLVIEVVFYFISIFFRKLDKTMILYGYLATILVGLVYYEYGYSFFGDFFYNLRFMLFILMGVAIYCDKQEEVFWKRYSTVAICIVGNLILFQINRRVFSDETTYPNFFSQAIPLALIVGLLELERVFPVLFDRVPKLLYRLATLVFPVFLTHICCGLTAMYWCSKLGLNRYLVVLIGFVVSFAVAKLISITVEQYSIRQARKMILCMQERRSNKSVKFESK